MKKISFLSRLLACGASTLVTIALVSTLAGYGLPGDAGATLLAQAASSVAR